MAAVEAKKETFNSLRCKWQILIMLKKEGYVAGILVQFKLMSYLCGHE